MVNVLTEIIIQRPASVVAAYASDPDNAPLWYKNIESAVWETGKPLSIGSRVAFVARFLGRQLAYTYVFTEWIPGQKLVMRTSEGPSPMETTYTWEAIAENSCKMTLRNQGTPTGFSKYLAPFMGMMMKKANKADLKKLKSLLEQAGQKA